LWLTLVAPGGFPQPACSVIWQPPPAIGALTQNRLQIRRELVSIVSRRCRSCGYFNGLLGGALGRENLRLPSLPRVTLGGPQISSGLRIITAAASFVIYASSVLALNQYRDNFLYNERVGLAAGVSYVVYRAPLGKVYPAVQAQLLDLRATAETALDKATRLGPPPGNPVTAINDGTGIGFTVASSWAMSLFGPHLLSLPFFMLGLMAISAAAFLWRFRDDRSAVVTVTFFSLASMLCTPLVWNHGIASQIPIGGLRYFSLLAIVPAIHLVLELADGEGHADGTRRLYALLLAVQVVLLALAILVRGSAASVAAPILLIGLVRVWRNRDNRNELRSLRRKAAVTAMVGAVFVGSLFVTLPSRYVRDGLLTTEFWHRVVISLGVNPGWPFGNLRGVYHCKIGDIPEGLVAGVIDRNGHCIWWSYLATHNIPHEVALPELYGSRYEAVMRAAFFNIVRLYPDEVLATFFYYKPESIVQSMEYLVLNPAFHSPILKVLVIAGFVNFLGFLAITGSFSTTHMMLRLTGLGALFGILSIPSYLVAWAAPHTTADLLFYCLLCIGLGLGAVMQSTRAAIRRTSAVRARA